MEPDSGSYKWGLTTTQAYFPKDNSAEFNNDDTIVDWLTQYSPEKDVTYVRGFLGRMLFAGEDGVAAYVTLMYVNFIFVSIFFGYAIGSAPIVSYHYGANNQDELKNLFHKSIRLIGTWAVSLFIIAQLIATPLATLFVGYDQGLFELTRSGFRLYSFAFLINGFNIYGSAFFTALNNGLLSALISFLRTLVFQMAVVLLLPLLLGINGVWCSVAIAELLTLCVTGTFIVLKRNIYHYL